MNDDEIRKFIDVSSTAAATKAATEATDKSRKQFETIVERLEANIQIVAEGHLALSRQITEMRTEMREGFREVNARIDVSVAQMNERYTTLEQRVGRLESIILKADKADA